MTIHTKRACIHLEGMAREWMCRARMYKAEGEIGRMNGSVLWARILVRELVTLQRTTED